MNQQEQRQFEILCATARMFIISYLQNGMIPAWIYRHFHSRGKHITLIINSIEELKSSANHNHNYEELYKDLLKLLMNHYYHLYVHTISKKLREKVIEALLACLIFNEADIKHYHNQVEKKLDMTAYMKIFISDQELARYRDYFASKHQIYGVSAKDYSKNDLELIAKTAMVNGKLIEKFSLKLLIHRALNYAKQEINELIKNHVEVGFLNYEVMQGHLKHIELLQQHCKDPDFVLTTLVHDTRYLLETIINSAGVLSLGPARYPEHIYLITCCYWIDEFMVQAQAGEEI